MNHPPFASGPLDHLRHLNHGHCIVCGAASPLGLGISFKQNPDGSVEGEFAGGGAFQGYDGMLHGGVIATLLDGAMTNCLFAHGRVAVTAELTVRYRRAVAADQAVTVRAWLEQASSRLLRLRAELTQNQQIKVTATAKFMDKT